MNRNDILLPDTVLSWLFAGKKSHRRNNINIIDPGSGLFIFMEDVLPGKNCFHLIDCFKDTSNKKIIPAMSIFKILIIINFGRFCFIFLAKTPKE
jgi:hypothetical protein